MAEPRKTREQDSRKADSRKDDSWIPQSQLPMPKAKSGIRFKYIRTASLDKSDNRNVSQRFREGWVPVKASEHPELQIMSDRDSKFPEGIEIGGLLLCQMPEEKAKQRNEHYGNAAVAQLEAADNNYMNDQHASMPKHNESKSRTEFGKGNS